VRKIERSEVLDLVEYEKARPDFQREAIAAKTVRRVAVGPLITCFFENRLTMQYQLQEMLRVERVVREEAIADELGIWNSLIPGADELSLTLMVEITDMSKAREKLEELKDLEPTVSLRIGALKVPARFEEGWSDENRISAVQYLRFVLGADGRRSFLPASEVRIAIEHRAYRHEASLPQATLAALREDLDTP
jgi:hypothetical protein